METSPQRKSIDASSVVQELTINQTTLKDKGVYYCNVSDNQNHFSVNSINITIYGILDQLIISYKCRIILSNVKFRYSLTRCKRRRWYSA
jgi:hypothetical protein